MANPITENERNNSISRASSELSENQAWPRIERLIDEMQESEFADRIVDARENDAKFLGELNAVIAFSKQSAVQGESARDNKKREAAEIEDFFVERISN